MSTGLLAALAFLPIAVILGLMLGLGQSAARAGVAGLVTTLVLVWTVFDFSVVAATDSRWVGSAGSLLEALFSSATILWIIFGALCLHQLQVRSGAIDVLRSGLSMLSADPRVGAVLVAWFFALFLEGAAGFGTPIALAAPFLVGMGFRPGQAVAMVLIGHCVGVSFGAVGTPVIAQMSVVNYTGLELSRAISVYSALVGGVMLGIVAIMAHRALSSMNEAGEFEKKPVKHAPFWPLVVAAAVCFLVPMYAIAQTIGPELPTLGGALLGAIAFIGLLTVWRRVFKVNSTNVRDAIGKSEGLGAAKILRAASPYLSVIILILLTRLVAPLQVFTSGYVWSWEYAARFSGKIEPLYHPGTLLVVGFFVGGFVQKVPLRQLGNAMQAALKQLGPVAVALLAMLAISRLMVHGGLIAVLADTAAGMAGSAWPLFAPVVGTLGGFITGSATASNILFTDFQQAAASRLGFPDLTMLGAQGFGAAGGNMIAPHNLIAGCATVGISGQEGTVLRQTLKVALLYVVLGGLVAWFLVWQS